MSLDNLPILTGVEDGQSYVDEPVYSKPAKRLLTRLNDTLAEIFGHVRYIIAPYRPSACWEHGPDDNEPIMRRYRIRDDWPDEILLRYNHVRLRWMKPNGNGGLTPR